MLKLVIQKWLVYLNLTDPVKYTGSTILVQHELVPMNPYHSRHMQLTVAQFLEHPALFSPTCSMVHSANNVKM